VGNDFSALRAILLATETKKTLSSLSVHKVDMEQSHDAKSPTLLMFNRLDIPVVIVIGRTANVGKHPLPLDINSLGFGKIGGDVHIPSDLIKGANMELPTSQLLNHLRKYERSVKSATIDSKPSRQQSDLPPDQLVLEMQRSVEAYRSDVTELRAHEAGLRAIIRGILSELRQINPQHPLLEEKTRKEIYDEFYQSEVKKHGYKL
jgi:hypothetical protein